MLTRVLGCPMAPAAARGSPLRLREISIAFRCLTLTARGRSAGTQDKSCLA